MLLSLPDLGGVLQALRISDDVRDYKFFRGLGAVFAVIGVVFFFLFQALAILINTAFIRLANYSLVVVGVGLLLLIVFFALNKRHRELDEKEREVDIDETESVSNVNNAVADRLSGMSTFQDRQQGESEQVDDEPEPDATTITVESKNK